MLELPGREGIQAELAARQQRPGLSRGSTFEGPVQLRQDQYHHYPGGATTPTRSPSAQQQLGSGRYASANPSYFTYNNETSDEDQPFADPGGDVSPYHQRKVSYGGGTSPGGATNSSAAISKKGPPPPPPSRAKKPPPPPPPVKRTSANTLYTVS